MLNRKHVLLAGAVAAAIPAVMAQAVTVTYTFDPNDYFVSTTTNGTYLPIASVAGASVTGGTTTPTVTLPVGDFLEFGLDARVTGNNTGPGGAALGIAAFQTGLTDSSNTSFNAATGAVVVNPFFANISGKGVVVAGSIAAATGTAGSYFETGNTFNANATYGATAPAELYKGMKIVPVGGGTATFSVTNLAGALQYVAPTGATSSGGTTYGNVTFVPGVDTLGTLPVLTVTTVTGSGTGPATTVPTSQKILSLTSTAPTSYGTQLGTAIKINGSGGSYTTGNTGAPVGVGQTTTFTAASTFSPITDKEIYALQLDQNGVAIATTNTTLIAAIIADINASVTGATASTVTGVYASLFPGYDVLITSAAGFSASSNGTAYLGLDFSQDTTDTGVTVTEIAAVPEPATATGLILGVSGMLLRRRKNRELAA